MVLGPYFLSQVRAENEEMRKALQETVKIKSDYEHLKQVRPLFNICINMK